jgi:hypothetical protein
VPVHRAEFNLATWTGKFATTLLQNYCQKQQWHAPQYQDRPARKSEGEGGVVFSVVVSRTLPRTGERQEARFSSPDVYRNAQDGRHFAAVYALFQVRARQVG